MTLLDVVDKQKTLLLINLSKIVPACIENARTYAKSRGISIHYEDESGGEGQILGDHKQLVSVFDNLLSNAIHYGHDDGYIRVTLRFDSPYIIASVEDNGIGIALEHQEKVFERFYRVDSAAASPGKSGCRCRLECCPAYCPFSWRKYSSTQ